MSERPPADGGPREGGPREGGPRKGGPRRPRANAKVEGAAARACAARILAEVLAGRASLPEALARIGLDGVEDRDAAFVRELAWGTARFAPRLDHLVRARLKRPPKARDLDVHALMMIGAYQLGWTNVPDHAALHATVAATADLRKDWARGLVNAVLRRLADDPSPEDTLPDAALHAHPQWLLARLRRAWPARWTDIVAAGNARPPLTLRAVDDAAMAQLREALPEARPGALATTALYLDEALDVATVPGFANGCVSVQDEGAQLAAHLLRPQGGERVLDACAAPGGKTLHIAQLAPEAEILAVEQDARRARRIEENFERAGLEITTCVADATRTDAWWDGRPFDRILLDAPCTATGILRRQPDVRLLRAEGDVAKLAAVQRALLDGLWPTLAPGGTLVYCTCSVLPEEGPMVVQAFLNEHPEAVVVPLEELAESSDLVASGPGVQLLPTTHAHDGFFYARLRRRAN